MRIAVGGFHHETNTFAPVKAAFEDFERADGWPALSRGDVLFDAVEGVNLPVSGFIDAALREGHNLTPLVWCSAVPSAHVTEDAYERIADMFLEDLAAAGEVDAVFLDLHSRQVVGWADPVSAIGPKPFVTSHSPDVYANGTTGWLVAGPGFQLDTNPQTSVAFAPVGIDYP